MSKNKTVIERHDRFMTHNYPRYPIAIAQGSGSRLTDERGRTYLDLFAGFGAGILGHCHDDLVAAGTKQMTRLWHVGNLLHTEPQTTLAESIAERAFGGKSFFCHSGSDANEAAFKIARLHGEGERHKIIATQGSFHGRGFASMVATGQASVSEGFAPLLPGFEHVQFNDLEAMKQAIDDETVAIIVEPIQGEGGVNVPDDDYLPGLRRLADEHDLVLIFDEVWTGCGRTGQWFAYQHWDTPPDVMTLGKAVGGGLPLGVTHVSDKFAPLFDAKKMGRVTHATTLGGNCVTAAVSARLLEVIERDGLLERARQVGEQIRTRLNKLAEQHESVVGVRGRGLFIGMELNPEADRAWFDSGAQVVKACLDRGVMVNVSQGKVLRLAPPLTISDEEVNEGLSVIEDMIAGHQE